MLTPNKTFKDFKDKTLLSDTDYIVGYNSDGTEEFKINLSTLTQYLKKYFVPKTMLASLQVDWDTSYNTVKNLSGNWNSVYTTTSTYSADWNSSYNTVKNLSGNWNTGYSVSNNISAASVIVKNLSGNWNSSYNTVKNLSGNWNSVYTTTSTYSADWNSSYNTVKNLSGNWNSVYTTTSTYSADWQAVANLPPPFMNYFCTPCTEMTPFIDRFWECISVKGDNELLAGCTLDGKIFINNQGANGSVWVSSFDNPNQRFSSIWNDLKIAENAVGASNIGLPNNNSGGLIVALSEYNKDGIVYISNNAGQNWYTSGQERNRNWLRKSLSVSSNGDKIVTLEVNGNLHRLNAGSEIVPWVNDSNWELISNTPFHNDNGFQATSVAASTDLNTIYVTAETFNGSSIFKSSDFGSTWTTTSITSALFWRSVSVGKHFSTDTVWASPDSSISRPLYYSMDGGITWNTSGSSQLWHSVYVKNSTVVALSRNNRIHISTNNGSSWVIVNNAPTNKLWKNVCIPINENPTFIYTIQESGRLFVSMNAGNNWSQLF
jgi:frataxin-like iron-binding protein CyaY